jgi:hypothetical protein
MFGRRPSLGHWVSYPLGFKLNEEFIRYKPSMNEAQAARVKLFDWMAGFLAFLRSRDETEFFSCHCVSLITDRKINNNVGF